MHQLTVLENVMLPMIKEDKSKAMELIDRMGLEGKYNKLPSQLSGGEQQRVAIARALINDPSIVFADEPTGSLDSKSATELLNYLKTMNQKEKATKFLRYFFFFIEKNLIRG